VTFERHAHWRAPLLLGVAMRACRRNLTRRTDDAALRCILAELVFANRWRIDNKVTFCSFHLRVKRRRSTGAMLHACGGKALQRSDSRPQSTATPQQNIR